MAPKSQSYQISAIPITFIVHLLVIAITALVLIWLLHFRGGLAFDSDIKLKIFNLHPLLTVAFILLSGEAIMAYKSVAATRKAQKMVHLTLHTLALVAGVLGIYAVFKFQHESGFPDMNTLHSWLGISTICLFGLQLLLGIFSFVFPGSEPYRRAAYRPWHVFGGMVIFFMAICTAESGFVEQFIFLQLKRNQEALIVNFTGLLLLLFAVGVGLISVLPRTHN